MKELEDEIDRFVQDGDFEQAWAEARRRAARPPRWSGPRLHRLLVAAAAIVAVGLAVAPGLQPSASSDWAIEAEIVAVGRTSRASAERPLVAIEVDQPSVLEARPAEGDPQLFAVFGRGVGTTDVRLVYADGRSERRRYEVVASLPPQLGEPWIDVAVGGVLLFSTSTVDVLHVADPARIEAVPLGDQIALVGLSSGVSDLLVLQEGEWSALTVQVGPGQRLVDGVRRPVLEPIVLSVGERLPLELPGPPADHLVVLSDVVELSEGEAGLQLSALRPGSTGVSLAGEGWARHLRVEVHP